MRENSLSSATLKSLIIKYKYSFLSSKVKRQPSLLWKCSWKMALWFSTCESNVDAKCRIHTFLRSSLIVQTNLQSIIFKWFSEWSWSSLRYNIFSNSFPLSSGIRFKWRIEEILNFSLSKQCPSRLFALPPNLTCTSLRKPSIIKTANEVRKVEWKLKMEKNTFFERNCNWHWDWESGTEKENETKGGRGRCERKDLGEGTEQLYSNIFQVHFSPPFWCKVTR